MTAAFHVLTTGYADERVAGTVTLLVDGSTVAIVDPGMVADRRLILDPLTHHGLIPQDVTDVIFSHHHPDHTLNAALFPEARFHDHMAIYRDDVWEDRDADGYRLSPSITLMTTPGHTAQDVSTLVTAAEGLVVLTHLWWTAEGPADDPFAPDREQLRAAREKVLALGPALVVPGHGAPFVPSSSTPL
ncbi:MULTISPECIES: MBL fold metallo-hydrolase [unclassified Streptomyces]|uniref:MBL fold metallo-hydrolase n=1 Tax=unclassified Streptomyces TaxID=2593676 RepID=UPI000F50B910|nr:MULTISPECIES: MBL fold metallo-hydrolase [unclassified Streptomyces]MDH6455233.1 glyoxylase-like metal-dependent hydrolase (beta-lactamase superfamily II) [Streptomyces sp. SAI-119]MDH6494214.1 glyoxylase-like metal-dependent hydrolase (beta-lactamase superfamily II) [Streptomyces sp. SAI-149]QUC58605.1 MBL fold metallo-hydrolase [Streptomyces sp. A2-16]